MLKTKKLNIAMCWGGLRNIPPKDFPTVGELENTGKILQILKDAVPEFVEVLEKGEKIGVQFQLKKTGEELVKLQEERQAFMQMSTKVETECGNTIAEIHFEADEFNTFFQQFERWGREWFYKIEPYLAFRKEMCDTNGQPKEKAA